MKPAKDIETMKIYASESQYISGPTEEQQASGTVPLDTLPADWWNWLWKEITIRINEAASDVQGLYQEILAILAEANIVPDPLLTNQLLVAIQTLIRRVGTETIAGAVKSSIQSGRVAISADGIMTVNGLGTPSTLNTVSHEVVGAINEVHSTLESYTATTDATLRGLSTGKAPTSHASSETAHGVGTPSLYGHVKLSDTLDSSLDTTKGVALTPKAVAGALENYQAKLIAGENISITDNVIRATASAIADKSVTTAKLNDAAVTTAKLNDAAVTIPKTAAEVFKYDIGCICTTSGGASGKIVIINNFKLVQGAIIKVLFINAHTNTSSNPALDVSYTGSKPIKAVRGGVKITPVSHSGYWRGATAPSFETWQPYTILELMYDGTDWVIIGNPLLENYVNPTTGAGYKVYADGLIEQWIDASSIWVTDAAYTWRFPVTFLNGKPICTKNCGWNRDGAINVYRLGFYNISNNSATTRGYSAIENQTGHAIGY